MAPCSQLAREDTTNATRLPTSSTVPNRMVLLNSRNISARIFCSGAPVRSISGLDAPPGAVGLDDAGVNAVDMHPIGLAAVGQAFGKRRHRRVHRAADVNCAVGLRPPVPPIETSAPWRSLSSGQAARASRIGRKTSARSRPPNRRRSAPRKSPRLVAPALLTRTSSPPNSRRTCSISFSAESLSRRSTTAPAARRPVFAHRSSGLLQRLGVAPGQHQIAALGRERQRDTAADAAARSGDQRDLAFKSQLHVPSLPVAASL